MLIKLDSIRKSLQVGKFSFSGRNNTGRITVAHRGGRVKKKYIYIDFFRKQESLAVSVGLEYDPNRTALIAFLYYLDGSCSYILAVTGLQRGSIVFSGSHPVGLPINPYSTGSAMPLRYMPVGFIINSVELVPGDGAKLARSAGTAAVILKKNDSQILLKLRSGWSIWIAGGCKAAIGSVSNASHRYEITKKAGVNRHLGKRPHVRGVAKNPIDHPHGGRTKGGRPSVTPWGRLTKGQPTVSRARRSRAIKRAFR